MCSWSEKRLLDGPTLCIVCLEEQNLPSFLRCYLRFQTLYCTKQPPAQIAGSCWHDPQLKRRLLPFDGPPARSRDLFEHRFCNIARLSSLCYHSSCIIALVSGAVSSSVSVLLTTPLCRKPPKCGNNS